MKAILIIDAVINFVLGILLLLFSPRIVDFLGVPSSTSAFYPNILGAVFIGITIALTVGVLQNRSGRHSGLGVIGAIAINLCGGLVLSMWLLFGQLGLPGRGFILLWSLVAVLSGVSIVELVHYFRTGK